MTVTINGTSGMTTPTGVFSDSTGKVGIGTTSPVDQLQVNTASTGGIRITNGTTGSTSSDGLWLGVDSSGQSYMYNSENTATTFYTNNTLQMTIASDGIVTGTAGNLMLVSGTAVTASSTSVDFTGIPSWVKRITISYTGISFDATASPVLRIGDSGGIEDTGYTSCVGMVNIPTGNVCRGGIASTYFLLMNTNNGTTATGFNDAVIFLTKVSGNTWAVGGSASSYTSSSAGLYAGSVAGYKTLSDTLTQVRLTSSSGTANFDAGTINILYE